MSTEYIENAIDEVLVTIFTCVRWIVSCRYLCIFPMARCASVIIPAVAVPLSLIGTFMAMLALGFSITLLTLLAMVFSYRHCRRRCHY